MLQSFLRLLGIERSQENDLAKQRQKLEKEHAELIKALKDVDLTFKARDPANGLKREASPQR